MILHLRAHEHNGHKACKSATFLTKAAILLCSLLLPVSSVAKQISEKRAKQLASDFFNRRTIKPLKVKKVATSFECRSTIKKTKSNTNADNTGYYVFKPETGSGFVIISGDDQMKPIVGYSTTSTFDVNNMPAQLISYLETYESNITKIQQGDAIQGRTSGGKAVAPLLTTQWNQHDPYNIYLEWNALTGCVATAVAQVMKYFNYPAKGNGIIETFWGATLDLSQSVYDWNNMKDRYNLGEYNDAESSAVALLMRDVGYALDTQYGTDASRAYQHYIAPVLYKHFNYSKDIQLLKRECYASQEWIDIIRENLLAGQPILYGAAESSGHEFVCDGIDENDYLHINWGWSGYCDGYFDVNALSPANLGGNSFYRDHDMVVNIHPGNPDDDNSDYEAPLLVWNFRLGDADYTDYFYRSPQLDSDGRLCGKTPLKFRLYYNLLNNTRQSTGYNEYAWYGALYDENKQLIKRFDTGTLMRGLLYHDRYRTEECCLFDFSDIADGNYYVSIWYKRDKDRSGIYEDKEFDFACDPFFPVTVKDDGLYFDPKISVKNHIEINSVEQKFTYYENSATHRSCLKITAHNNNKEAVELNLSIYSIPESEAVDNPDISTLEIIGNAYNIIYGDATVTLNGSIKENLPQGRYRLYFGYYSKELRETVFIQSDKKYFFEVTALPNDVPLVFTEPFEFKSTSYENVDWTVMEFKVYYMPTGNNPEFFSYRKDIQFWAAPISNPENKFLLYELLDDDSHFFSSNLFSTSFKGVPDLLWKTPGEYRIWMKVRTVGEENWLEFNDPNNTGTFTLTEYHSNGQTLYMTEPMKFEHGNLIKPNKGFNVTMKVKSPTGINMLLDNSAVIVTDNTARTTTLPISYKIEADKTELAPGEETEMRLKFYPYDNENIYGKRFMIMVYVRYDENHHGEYIVPGEYMESIYFTIDPLTNTNDATTNSVYNQRIDGNILTITDINAGETVEIWSDTGILAKREQANSNRYETTLGNLPAGIYIVKVHSKNKTYQSTKIVLK